MAANVLVFVELRDSEVRRPSLEAAGVARRLADILGVGVDAVALGPGAGGAAALLGRHGVDRLFTVEATAFELYAAEGYAEAMATAARQAEPAVILLGGTAMGRDLGARLAAKLRCGCASDLIEIDAGDIDAVIRATDGQDMDGRPLRVNEAREREAGGRGGGGGGGGGYR